MKFFIYILEFLRYTRRFGLEGSLLLLKKLFTSNLNITFVSNKFRHPIILRNNTSDFSVFHQIFLDEEYLIDLNFEPLTIIDCGANVGYAAIYFKNRFPNAKIISIEPDISNFESLKINTKLYNDIFILQGAIWNKNTDLVIKDIGLGNWGFMIEEFINEHENSITAYTIQNIMLLYEIDKIDILKIDIEGSEKELFESNFEFWLGKVKVIIIEFHDVMRPGSSKSFFNAISNYDYKLKIRGEYIIIYFNNQY